MFHLLLLGLAQSLDDRDNFDVDFVRRPAAIDPVFVAKTASPTPSPQLSTIPPIFTDFGGATYLQPIFGEGGGGGYDDPKTVKPGTPKPPVSVPLFVVQFSICLPSDTKAVIEASLTNSIQKSMPGKNPWFATVCGNSGTIIGIWLTQPSGSDSVAARTQGATSAAFLSGGETFGVRLGAPALQKFVSDAWQGLSKSFNTEGDPSSSGPIFLQSFKMDLIQLTPSAGQMKMTINGKFKGPADIPFKVEVKDTLTKAGGKILCSATNSIDVDTSLIEGLIAVSVFTAPFLVPPLVDALHQADSYKELPAGVLPESQKCVAKNAIPDSIPLTGGLFKGKKVDFQYSRLVVNNGDGILVAGTWSLVPRQPSVKILGPSIIKGDLDQDKVSAFYTIETVDMVRPFKSAVWTASGALSMTSGTSSSGWPTLSVVWPGQAGTKTVGITVKDVDDLVASTTKSTKIQLTDGLPPVCAKKNYLPQCQ